MLLAPAIVLLASGASEAPQPAATAPATDETEDAAVAKESAERQFDYDRYLAEQEAERAKAEVALLKKKRLPLPPSQDRKEYLAWRKQLSKATRKKIDRFCRREGAVSYYELCNGIGPYGIPVPPSLVAVRRTDADGNLIGMSHEQWQASLTLQQARWYHDECVTHGGEDENGYSQLCGGTPIVLAFSGEHVRYMAGTDIDWPTAITPWLARDVDGDGAITSSAELFGSDTVLPTGGRADNGFTALAPLDANLDGVLDARDAAFASLVIWADRDGDRQSSPAELTPLADTVVSIQLANARIPHCDARGNCEGERSAFTWRDAFGALHEGAAIDVYLRYQ